MHWSDFLATLPPEQGAQIVNSLTVGYGTVALAVHRAAGDASLTTVERAVAVAHDALVRSLALLPEPFHVCGERVLRLPLAPVLPALTWREFLAARGWDETQELQALLTEAVGRARRSGAAIMADGEAEAVVADIEAARTVLARLHDRLLSAYPG